MTISDNLRPILNKKARHLLGFFYIIVFGIQCSPQSDWVAFHGTTMGTTYSITIESKGTTTASAIQRGIDSVLTEINRQMSTYIPTSEISSFNALPPGDTLIISEEFAQVLDISRTVWELTGGAFDVTVYPLVKLWGFGPEADPAWHPPTGDRIEAVRSRIGFSNIWLSPNRELTKRLAGISLDLNAVAKGFGVDQVARYLEGAGISNYLVEIGGEVRCRGTNRQGKRWSVGIDRPAEGSVPGEALESVLQIKNRAVATSGDYRSFHKYKGQYYSHAIDPRNGFPTKSGVASATVVAPTCAFADALATAMMILGEEEGLRLAESLTDVEILLIQRIGNGEFRERMSSGMKRLLR
ncbi:MAG: FAD:protein FMN transferase [FCB group bacterium]|nr:FAD:protein FMN transferase [FCB group bacterium]